MILVCLLFIPFLKTVEPDSLKIRFGLLHFSDTAHLFRLNPVYSWHFGVWLPYQALQRYRYWSLIDRFPAAAARV